MLCYFCCHLVWLQKGPPRFSEESVLQLERELVQARLKEAESQCALKEMQDKILDMEKVRCTGAVPLNSYPVQAWVVTYYPIFVLIPLFRGTPHYLMTLMWHDCKRSWSEWSWEKLRLWLDWRSWGSRSETWRSTGRWDKRQLVDRTFQISCKRCMHTPCFVVQDC